MLQGNSLADMSRLVFRDPDHFNWNMLLDDLNDERFSEVRDIDGITYFPAFPVT